MEGGVGKTAGDTDVIRIEVAPLNRENWVVVSDMFMFNLYLGLIEPTDSYLSNELKPTNQENEVDRDSWWMSSANLLRNSKVFHGRTEHAQLSLGTGCKCQVLIFTSNSSQLFSSVSARIRQLQLHLLVSICSISLRLVRPCRRHSGRKGVSICSCSFC